MKTFEISTSVEQLDFAELTADEQQLAEKAKDATYRSYAPYSNFSVGAAILLSNGEVVTGANQENVAFPSGTCAERTAAFYAHAQNPDAAFVEIAIAARGLDGEFVASPISPCGACRQALLQYELLYGNKIKVLLIGRDYAYRFPSIASLLPFAFTSL